MSFRPKTLKDVIGQTHAKEILRVLLESNEDIPHILFQGSSGTGKTTLAQALANEAKSHFYMTNGGNTRSIKDLIPFLMRLEPRDIFFIDEVHRMPEKVQEFLYTVMEDFRLDLGKSSMVSLDLPKFTMIGATTESGMLLQPFYNRFVLKISIESYRPDDIMEVILGNLRQAGLKMNKDVALNFATRCRGVPRIANNYLEWIVKYAKSKRLNEVSQEDLDKALDMLGVDKEGLTNHDRAYLAALRMFGVPLGLKTIMSYTNLSKETIENVVEPFLLQLGYIVKTQQGRLLSEFL